MGNDPTSLVPSAFHRHVLFDPVRIMKDTPVSFAALPIACPLATRAIRAGGPGHKTSFSEIASENARSGNVHLTVKAKAGKPAALSPIADMKAFLIGCVIRKVLRTFRRPDGHSIRIRSSLHDFCRTGTSRPYCQDPCEPLFSQG